MRTKQAGLVGWPVLALVLLIGWAVDARATAYNWDASGAAPLDDGAGNWNATGGANWNTGASYGAWGNGSFDTATFGVASGAAGTITVGTVNCGGMIFNAPGSLNYTLSGGTITRSAGTFSASTANLIWINSGSPTINSDIAGNGDIQFLNSANTITLNGVISGTDAAKQVNVRNAKVYFNNPNNSFVGIAGVGGGGGGTLYVGANAPSGSNGALGNSTVAVNVYGNGALLINGAYTVGRNIATYNDGSIIGGSTADSSVFSGNIDLNTSGNITFISNPNGTVTFSGNLSGANQIITPGNVGYSNGGDFILSGDNSGWSGNLVIDAGRFIIGSNTALGTSTATISVGRAQGSNSGRTDRRAGLLTQGAVTVTRNLDASGAAGQVWFGGTTADASSYSGTIVLSASQINYFTAATNGQVTFSNAISGGAITKIDTGTVVLSGTNTYTGGTTISAGMLVAGNTNALGPSGTITVSSNGTFGVGAGVTFTEAVTFNAGSGLGGSGTFNRGAAWTLLSNFRLTPGLSTNETGTLTVDTDNNALTAAAGTRLEIDFKADGSADQLVVAGTGSLALGTGNATLVLRGTIKGGSYVVAIAPGGITGTFNTPDTSELNTSDVNVTYPGDGTVVVAVLLKGTVVTIR